MHYIYFFALASKSWAWSVLCLSRSYNTPKNLTTFIFFQNMLPLNISSIKITFFNIRKFALEYKNLVNYQSAIICYTWFRLMFVMSNTARSRAYFWRSGTSWGQHMLNWSPPCHLHPEKYKTTSKSDQSLVTREKVKYLKKKSIVCKIIDNDVHVLYK